MRKKKAEDDDSRPMGGADAPGSDVGRLSPIDIQQVEFRRAFKGYEERQVDEFLDRLTEDFAAALDEKQRLRARLDASASGSLAAPDLADVSRQADEIIQRARDDAAALIRDAEAQAAAAGPIGTADRAAIGAFLSREKEFLQSLATLVQGHAEGVKGLAASARRATVPASPTPAPASEDAPTEEGPATDATPSAPAPSATQPVAPVPTGGTGERRIELPDAEASIGSGAPGPGQGEQTERSLRELFWGEE